MPPFKYNDWNEFYHAKHQEGGTFLDLFNSKVSAFNETSLDHLNDAKALKVTIASSRYNFVLLPGPDKGLHVLHSTILVAQGMWEEPVLIGLQGSRATSPFRMIPVDQIITPIRTKRMTQKSNEMWTPHNRAIPSLILRR
jgi:hypothetical protein